MWGGHPAQQIQAESNPTPDGKKKSIQIRSFTTESKGYIGVVLDDGELTLKEVSLFFDSFNLLPGAKEKKP